MIVITGEVLGEVLLLTKESSVFARALDFLFCDTPATGAWYTIN